MRSRRAHPTCKSRSGFRGKQSMITIGLVGGVASGKSFVAKAFQDLGAAVLDGDRAGHEVLRQANVQRQLVDRWGGAIVGADGVVDRSAVARRVFGDTPGFQQELAFLEAVTHPEIERLLTSRLAQYRQLGRHRAVILDAAVMLKAGWDRLCDHVIFVAAPTELRLRRALLRGLSEQEFFAREESQTPIEEKKKRADLVIDNAGPPQKTRRQVEEVWHSLTEIA